MIWKECSHVSVECGIFCEKESKDQVTLVLLIRERRHAMTCTLVPRKGTEFPWIAKRAAKFFDQLEHNRCTLRCHNEQAIETLARRTAQARQEGSQTVPERPPVGEGQSNGIIERTVGLVAGQARTPNAAMEHRIGVKVPFDARLLCWLVEFRCVSDERARHRQRRKDADTQKTAWTKGQHTGSVHACQTSQRRKVGPANLSWIIHWNAELVIGSSGRHRARASNQNMCNERRENF